MRSNSPATAFKGYRQDDKASYIKHLQRMLGVAEIGFINKETVRAVQQIKRLYPGADNILVDYCTFLAIQEMYRNRAIHTLYPFKHRYMDCNEEINGINQKIGIIIKFHKLRLRTPKGRVFGYDTLRAIKFLRQVYLLADDDTIDSELLYCIEKDYMSIIAMKNSKHDG